MELKYSDRFGVYYNRQLGVAVYSRTTLSNIVRGTATDEQTSAAKELYSNTVGRFCSFLLV